MLVYWLIPVAYGVGLATLPALWCVFDAIDWWSWRRQARKDAKRRRPNPPPCF